VTAEFDRCSCEEALALREELRAASAELKQVADERDAALDRAGQSDEAERQALARADKAERAAESMRTTLEECIKRDDEELAALKTAQAIIGAHNELVAKHKSECAALHAELRKVLDEAGISADVDEGRDPAEAARSLRRDLNAAQDEAAALRAEVERLRADATEAIKPALDMRAAERDVALTQLAAANALIREMRDHIEQDRRPGSLFRRSGAHLSSQPAAPVRTETVVASGYGVTIRAVSVTPDERAALNTRGARLPAVQSEHTAGCRYEEEFPAIDPEDCPRCSQPAAPPVALVRPAWSLPLGQPAAQNEPEGEPWCAVCMRRQSECLCPQSPELRCAPESRTAAEQRVPEATLNVCMAPPHISPCIGEPCWWCKAELARREGK